MQPHNLKGEETVTTYGVTYGQLTTRAQAGQQGRLREIQRPRWQGYTWLHESRAILRNAQL